MKLRDRIKELRRVKASEILPNPANWRTHPKAQQDAMRGILAEVGIADALLVRETPAGLQLIDGHLRADVAPTASGRCWCSTSTTRRPQSCWRPSIRWPRWPKPTPRSSTSCCGRSTPTARPSSRCWRNWPTRPGCDDDGARSSRTRCRRRPTRRSRSRATCGSWATTGCCAATAASRRTSIGCWTARRSTWSTPTRRTT